MNRRRRRPSCGSTASSLVICSLVYLLTDEDFDSPCFNFDSSSDVFPGFKVDFWPGYENYATCHDVGGGEFQSVGPASGSGEQICAVTSDCRNAGAAPAAWLCSGVWCRVTWQATVTTTTGNINVRLLRRQKYAGRPQASAWDNVTLSFILPCNVIRFDVDDDGDVDQSDFAVLQACYTGADDPAGIFDAEACRCANSDGDLDIDAEDVLAFEACALGPGVIADITCDNALSPP